jgi:hypothetical protein
MEKTLFVISKFPLKTKRKLPRFGWLRDARKRAVMLESGKKKGSGIVIRDLVVTSNDVVENDFHCPLVSPRKCEVYPSQIIYRHLNLHVAVVSPQFRLSVSSPTYGPKPAMSDVFLLINPLVGTVPVIVEEVISFPETAEMNIVPEAHKSVTPGSSIYDAEGDLRGMVLGKVPGHSQCFVAMTGSELFNCVSKAQNSIT